MRRAASPLIATGAGRSGAVVLLVMMLSAAVGVACRGGSDPAPERGGASEPGTDGGARAGSVAITLPAKDPDPPGRTAVETFTMAATLEALRPPWRPVALSAQPPSGLELRVFDVRNVTATLATSSVALASSGREDLDCALQNVECFRIVVDAEVALVDPARAAPVEAPLWCLAGSNATGNMLTLRDHFECQSGPPGVTWPRFASGTGPWKVSATTFAREEHVLSTLRSLGLTVAAGVPGCPTQDGKPDRKAADEWEHVRKLLEAALLEEATRRTSAEERLDLRAFENELQQADGEGLARFFAATMADAIITAVPGGGIAGKTVKAGLQIIAAELLQEQGLEEAAAQLGGSIVGALASRLLGDEAAAKIIDKLTEAEVKAVADKFKDALASGEFVFLRSAGGFVRKANKTFSGTVTKDGCSKYHAVLSLRRGGKQVALEVSWTYVQNRSGAWEPHFEGFTITRH